MLSSRGLVDELIRATLFALVLVVVSWLTPSPAHADGTGCLPAPLPSTPLPPVFSRDVQRAGEQSHLDLWRQPCPGGGWIVLLRVTPITSGAFICDFSFTLVQGPSQFDILLTNQDETFGFCDSLFVPETFYVAPDGPDYDPQQAFTLLFDTVTGSPRFAALQVAAAGPATPPPTITVVATGCSPCRGGQFVGYVMNITNPGPVMAVELKAGARFPDGSILALVNTLATLPNGSLALTLVPVQALPAVVPSVDLLVEATILEPKLGVTLSRHSVPLHLSP
jgi:hypothetical protein